MAVAVNTPAAVAKEAVKLFQVHYIDIKQKIRLSVYADTIFVERSVVNNREVLKLAGIRMGGYPAMVRAMADAIYGGGTITVEHPNGGILTILSHGKRYTREHRNDGIYAEALLLIQRETEHIQNESQEGDDQLGLEQHARTEYIYCLPDDTDSLYREFDRISNAPMIPEFKDYLLSELQSRGILERLDTLAFKRQVEAWKITMTPGEKNIFQCINDGIMSGAISIPEGQDSSTFDGINTLSQYLKMFGSTVADRIRNQFNPLFDPAQDAVSPEVLKVNDTIKQRAGYSLFAAQLAAAEALKRRLKHSKYALLVAECGSGKTKIGSAAISAAMQSSVRALDKAHTFNIVLSPSHVQDKWVREIKDTIPHSQAATISSITELRRFYAQFQKSSDSFYVVLSKEKARDGYMRRPAVVWNARRKAFLCPDCMREIEMEISDDGDSYKVAADAHYFRQEAPNNRTCEHCGSPLWTALNPDRQSPWVKIADYGYVHRSFAGRLLSHKLPRKVLDDIEAVAKSPNGHFAAAGAYRRFALSTYIRKKMRGAVYGLIGDELHQYNNKSGQGDALGELYNTSKKFIGQTATLINGYASGIFYLLYRLCPHLMKLDGWSYDKPARFHHEYGVTEYITTAVDESYSANRRVKKSSTREKKKPGVSPLVYSRFLLEATVFLFLADMGKHLPDYEEIPVSLPIPESVAAAYKEIEDTLAKIMKREREIANKVLSKFMALLTVYPDQPYDQEPIYHPFDREDILAYPPNLSSFNALSVKDEKVLELVKQKIANGEKVLIYTSWVRIDTQKKLMKLFAENGIHADTLQVKVSPRKREKWVNDRLKKGMQVLITNPSLVETGLDLNDFTTLIYYNIGYNLFTLRQSSRRSWRINQTAPRIEVYFFYYENTMQHRAIRLMASKLAVASLIEGNLSDEGLAAMGDCDDLTTAMARELTMGIKGEIEDLSEAFKKMAFIKETKYGADLSPTPEAECDSQTEAIAPLQPGPRHSAHIRSQNGSEVRVLEITKKEEVILSASGRRKKIRHVDGQLSLFDLTA
ncbi:hypothetical protein LJC32_04630 [Oscillospiraceae bacterium OttesenSCG-928-F05]|nr:hypothetical protein [Oscillospiraceae bacterium OttesenSCG-928-F05]